MGNIILKITALVCAMALWFYVISLKDFQLTMEVPLTFVKLPEALAIASKPPSMVSVTVEGKPLDLIRLQSQKQSAMVVDMHNAELGSKRIHLDSKNFVAPNFASVHYVEPDNQYLFIDVAVDTRIERSIPIKSNVNFNAAPGYVIVQQPKLTQEDLLVSGARNALTRIIDISTDSAFIDSIKESKTYSVKLMTELLPPFVTPSDSMAKIFVDVQKIKSKEFKNIPIQLIGFYDRALNTLSPQQATVEVTGGDKVIEAIKHNDIELFIEYNRFAIEDADSLAPTVKLNLPPDIDRSMSIKAILVKPDKIKLIKTHTESEDKDEEYGI
jgi:YbbR domain-containing protein